MTGETLPPKLLISGVPGAGKSSFADSLGESCGFRVLKFDDDAATIVPMIRLATSGQHDAAAKILGPRVIVEWGFMPDTQAAAVAAVLRAGFEGWWFDAEFSDALPKWKEKHTGVDERYFHDQTARITSHRHVIEALFPGHIIRTLKGKQHMTTAQIRAAMERVRQPKK